MTPSGAPAVLTLFAPVDGYLVPLDELPDETFRGRMVGDGVAIDPVGDTLLAPCDATVVQVHRGKHALVLDADGLELVLHLGLDTVRLGGAGMEPLVVEGQRVRRGEPLLRFDADVIAERATSLLTPLVVAQMEQVERIEVSTGRAAAGRTVVMRVLRKAVATAGAGGGPLAVPSAVPIGAPVLRSGPLRVADPTGLHARPAAVLAATARRFSAEVQLELGDRRANVRSVVSLLALEVAAHDTVTVTARGTDAAAALDALSAVMVAAPAAPTALPIPAAPPPQGRREPVTSGSLRGVPASAGLAGGVVVQWQRDDFVEAVRAPDAHSERRALDAALQAAQRELQELRSRLEAGGHAERAQIFAAHHELVQDPELRDLADAEITAGWNAAWAWHQAYEALATRIAGLRDPVLAARATDLRDVGRRVLHRLLGDQTDTRVFPADAVVIAEDLAPSDLVELEGRGVRGVCVTMGSATSHVAILARGLGLPAIAGLDAQALGVPDGTRVLVDGDHGVLRIAPSAAEEGEARRRQDRAATRRAAAVAVAAQPAVTRDGLRIEVAANIGDLRSLDALASSGADGVGLLRSEFVFQDRRVEPTEDEQAEVYARVARAMGPDRLVIIRTLDVGGDKPLAYLPIGREANPFLGERGLRFLLTERAVLRRQLRAILRAGTQGRVAMMFPMVATRAEWAAGLAVLEEERAQLGLPRIPVGLMVETPAAALQAERFAAEADFLSVGTNDLTQYTLAMDRTHPRLAPAVDALHPAVLRLIGMTAAGAQGRGTWAGVCGAVAADLIAVPLLVGLGITELSVEVPMIAEVKARVRELTAADCRATVEDALRCVDGTAVRALVHARHGEGA